MMSLRRTRVSVVVMAAIAGPASGGPDFEDLSQAFCERHSIALAEPGGFDFDAFARSGLAHARLGIFELAVAPADVRDAKSGERLRAVALTLLGLQADWLSWLEPACEAAGPARADQAVLKEWVASWNPERVAEHSSETGDLFASLGASEEVRAAGRRFAEAMTSGALLGLARDDVPERLILAPDRRSFLEYAAFAGWIWPDWRHVFWQPEVADWTHVTVGAYLVLALEYAAPERAAGDWFSGLAMDYRSPTGLEQQIGQLAANSMLAAYYGDRVPPSIAGALAVNLVVEQFGECDTRVDGDLRARRTEAREVFVPGGNPTGGVLPPNPATSRWREQRGADHFVGALQRAQKSGLANQRRPKHRGRYFELLDESGSNRTVLEGPYLGEAATRVEPPPASFQGDYLEFLRAYRSCFVRWLQTEANDKKSPEGFARLLLALAAADGAEAVVPAIEETFEQPLSDPDLDRETLEGRFLEWLRKQR